MSNKESAIDFLRLAGSGKVTEAFNQYVSPDFIHHNQYFEGTRDALEEAMKSAHQSAPNKSIDIRYTYVDGDTVICHSHVVKKDVEIAVVHIFRFRGEKIVELWDLGQAIDEDSPNVNGLF